MPFTPFHFGPGLAAKAALPSRVSFTAFVATQVIIDFETLYHLVRVQWPVHRQLHSLVGGSAVGLAVAAGVVAGRPRLDRVWGRLGRPPGVQLRVLAAETTGLA